MRRILAAATLASLAALLGPATRTNASGLAAFVTGAGEYSIPAPTNLEAQFAFLAVSSHDGDAAGWFRHRGTFQGQIIDFTGRVTCLSTDPVNDRAWIGGVVTRNRSTHPSFQTPIHQVGRDIWFRVVDYGSGNTGVPDRTTFVGFEMDTIPTSQFYCDTMPWPADDARTWPITGFVKLDP